MDAFGVSAKRMIVGIAQPSKAGDHGLTLDPLGKKVHHFDRSSL
jgi:hypothetical protein